MSAALTPLREGGAPTENRLPRTRGGRGARSTSWVVLGALVAVAFRIPYIGTPLRPDEGGFLLLGSQWHVGTSLYGDYWVDRPPLLVAFFSAADWLGGATALRVMGCGLAFAVILLAHVLGRSVTGIGSLWPPALALALVTMPTGGAMEVNGELIAAPLVLLGLIASIRAADARGAVARRSLWTAAGALGAAAVMVKQNFADVLVFGVVLVVASALAGPRGLRRFRGAAADLAAFVLGGILLAAASVLGAATRGTTPAGLWDALVVFRLDAGLVIADSASAATDARFHRLLGAMCLSGSVALMVVFLAYAARRWRQPLVVATVALLAWELFGVLAGGSYWLHYLVGLIPGLVLAVALVGPRPRLLGLAARAVVCYAVVVAAVTAPAALVTRPPSHEALPAAATWLQQHAHPGDTATILYGGSNILQAAGLSSPYPELWSLPVRVRDPDLAQLQAVLNGPDAPTWLLASRDLETWGVAAGPAFDEVMEHYVPTANVEGFTIYHRLQARQVALTGLGG